MTTCLAFDFGGSSVKYALVDDDARLSESGKLPAPLASIDAFVDAVAGVYERFADRVDGIAVSIPGYVDPRSGVLSGSGVYTALYGTSISELLESRFPVSVTVENDGKCAALAEAWRGSLADAGDGAVIVLGTGVAGGIVKDRRVHHGRGFAAGEFSFLITDPSDSSLLGTAFMSCAMLGVTYRVCKAKNLSFDAQDSGAVLAWLDSVIDPDSPEPATPPLPIKADGRQFFAWLDEGDTEAIGVYRAFISSLAVVVHNVQVTFAPERVVIGGGLSLQDRVLDDLRAELARRYDAMSLAPELQAHVVRSTYLDEGNVVGAAFDFLTRATTEVAA